MPSPLIELVTLESDNWKLAAARDIFQEYAASLPVDLSRQGFDEELRGLPHPYVAPHGQLLLAVVDAEVAGCGAFRPIQDTDHVNACELKRLYVRPAFRRFGLGRMLAQALMDEARRAGYSCVLLDTLDDMEAARGLYESLGFREIPPYYYSPFAGSHYLRADLD